MFMNIYRTIFVQAYLLRVDFLNPRILQADALLMHRGAKKKELTFLYIFTFTKTALEKSQRASVSNF